MKDFDVYEYIGLIAPGAVVSIAIFLQWPQAREAVLLKDFSLGSFGVFLICSFILGHLVQAIGNILEKVFFWPLGGLPTNEILKPSCTMISPTQRVRLIEKTRSMDSSVSEIEDLTAKQWYPLTREIYAEVAAAGNALRVDAFNRNYGLLRGIASALILITAWFLCTRWGDWKFAGMSALLLILALARMRRFANLYARELFIQFIRVAPASAVEPESAKT